MIWTIIGWLAVALTATQFIPQVVKSLKTKQLRDVSLGTFLLIVLTASTWIIYGIAKADVVIITANALVLISALIISAAKIAYKS